MSLMGGFVLLRSELRSSATSGPAERGCSPFRASSLSTDLSFPDSVVPNRPLVDGGVV